ncbi:MAG: hypothetical protein QOK37_3669 [Thermoanaerobaculia bacterium]|jgi:membrane protein|nr:hypothetical protein [Thermoanaerobaculia bacterium]
MYRQIRDALLTIWHIDPGYGPAGSVIVVMVWAYWSAQIFFFGLELTHVYSANDHDEIAREGSSDRRVME